jgi:hypothetical protein
MEHKMTNYCTMHKERTGWQGKPAIAIVIRNAARVNPVTILEQVNGKTNAFCAYLDSLGIISSIDISNRRERIFTDQTELNTIAAAISKYFGPPNAEGVSGYNGAFVS